MGPKTQRTWFKSVYHSSASFGRPLDVCLSPAEQSKPFNLGLSSNALDNYGGCRGPVLGKNNRAASSMMQSLKLAPLLCSYTKSCIEGAPSAHQRCRHHGPGSLPLLRRKVVQIYWLGLGLFLLPFSWLVGQASCRVWASKCQSCHF